MKIKAVVIILVQALLITGVVLIGVIPFSCKITEEGIEIIGGDYSSPYLHDVNVIDEKTIAVSFSEEVKLQSVVISPLIYGISDSDVHSTTEVLSPALAAATGDYGKIEPSIEYSEDKSVVTLLLDQPTEIGKSYEIFGVVEDRIGNTLTFTIPFAGYNSAIPKMIMTEIQIKYGKGSLNGETVYRGEYVELLALEDGNLTGLEIISASDGEKKKFEFPNVEVTKGEIILVHLRTVDAGCINETDDLDAAFAPHSKNGIRDLWDVNTGSRFNDNSDVIILRNRVDGSVMDGIMYASADATEWKSGVAEYALDLQEAGIYSSWEISNASGSKGCTTLRSLTRQNSKEIYDAVMNDEDYEYPLPVENDYWLVELASPGVL